MSALILGLLLIATPPAADDSGPGAWQDATRPAPGDTLRLPALQDAAVRQDPRLRQVALEEAGTTLRLRNLDAERLPELRITGEATRQSEVAAIPLQLPGTEVPAPPKNRYELALNASWVLFDGGVVGGRRDVERAELAAAKARLAAELYPLRMEVMEAFFGALLLQQRVREQDALIEDLQARLSEVREHVGAGTALPGDTAAVKAEVLGAMQGRSEVAANRRASLAVLRELTGREIMEADVLALPELASAVAAGSDERGLRVHPQYALFEARRARLDEEATLARARTRPQLSAFGRYAYGSPGLRQFTDSLHDYWIGGLRLQWAPWDWGTAGRTEESIRIRREIVDSEDGAFSARLVRQVQQSLQAMERLEGALETDAQIIELREQVERQARAQFAERAITAAAYIDARTDLQEARLALHRHRAELARAQAEYLTILGVELR